MRHDITPADIQAAINTPDDFGYSGDLPIGRTWSLGPVILNRNSGPLDQVNSKAIRDAFAEAFGTECEDNGWEVTRCGHWAVGWVEHLSFRVADDNGQATPQFQLWRDIEARMDGYPCLDDDALSVVEYEALTESVFAVAEANVRADAPEGWHSDVMQAAWDRVSHDSNGWPYVSDDDILDIMRDLDLLADDDTE